jgi:hypothetical protein
LPLFQRRCSGCGVQELQPARSTLTVFSVRSPVHGAPGFQRRHGLHGKDACRQQIPVRTRLVRGSCCYRKSRPKSHRPSGTKLKRHRQRHSLATGEYILAHRAIAHLENVPIIIDGMVCSGCSRAFASLRSAQRHRKGLCPNATEDVIEPGLFKTAVQRVTPAPVRFIGGTASVICVIFETAPESCSLILAASRWHRGREMAPPYRTTMKLRCCRSCGVSWQGQAGVRTLTRAARLVRKTKVGGRQRS